MENYKILKDLVKFNTIKDKENSEIMDYIEKYLKSFGFTTEQKTKNLVMSIGNNTKLGFLGHTDTVEYIEDFKNPFDIKEDDEYLYGLGVCDMKGGIAAILYAIQEIDFSNLKNGMKLYFTYDEEILFGGIRELVQKDEKFPQYMIFGEPTDNEYLTAGKGLLEVEVCFKGKKAHSSNPEKGISANLNAVQYISELRKYYMENIKCENIEFFEIPYTTMNLGLINGGSAINSIPAKCTLNMDFRIADIRHTEMIENKLNELANKFDAKVRVIDSIKLFANKINFIENIKAANFITEASFVDDSKKIILGTGPVTAHEVNEHISKKSFEKLIGQYKGLIEKICC